MDDDQSTNGRFVTLVIVVVALVAYPALRYAPASAEIEQTLDDARSSQLQPRSRGFNDAPDLAVLKQEHAEIQARINVAQSEVDGLSDWFSRPLDRQALRVSLSETARSCGISIIESTFNAAESSTASGSRLDGNQSRALEQVRIRGDYSRLIEFLRQLEFGSKNIVVSHFEMQPTDENGGIVEAKIALAL